MNRSRVTNSPECPPEAVINHGPRVRRFKEQPGRLAASLMNSRCQPYHAPPSLGDCFVEFTAYSHSSSEQRHGISRRRGLPPLKIGSEPQFDQSVRIAGASALFNLSSGIPTVAFYWRGSAGPVATDAPRNTR